MDDSRNCSNALIVHGFQSKAPTHCAARRAGPGGTRLRTCCCEWKGSYNGPAAKGGYLFERITINRQSTTGEPIDLGFLAQCLIFYERVRVIADVETFRYLVRCCGPDELLDLLQMRVLEIEFFDNMTGVATVETNIGPLHELKAFHTNSIRYPQVSRKLFDELSGPSGKGANKMFRSFERFVERSTYTTEMLQEAHADILDPSYLGPAISSLLSFLAPNYSAPNPLVFRVEPVLKGGTYKVTTNIDFGAANASYNQHAPLNQQAAVSVPYLLGHIADTRRDLIVGSRLQSEFAVAPARALIASHKVAEILSAAGRGTKIAEMFQETVVDDVPSIREVVNSGQKNFRDVVRLVTQAEKFKEWLRKQGGTEDLRASYRKEIGHLDWADKLPPKALRFLMMTAAGIIVGATTSPVVGVVATTAISAGDTFLLDKLLKGWKPNHFVEGPLKQFLR